MQEQALLKKTHQTKYITFQITEHKPKTVVWWVRSKHTGASLGYIKWYGPWRQYVFSPEDDVIFNHGCLMDLRQFLIQQNKAQRAKKKNES